MERSMSPKGIFDLRGRNQWVVALLIVAGLQATACAPKPSVPAAEKPAHTEEIQGSKLKRVILTQKAQDRLGIETAVIQEEQVARKRRVGAEVVASPATAAAAADAAGDGAMWVRVRFNESDLNQVDNSQPARILPLSSDDGEDQDEAGGEGVEAEADEGSADDDEDSAGTKAVYYVVRGSGHNLQVGQRMLVEVALKEGSGVRKLIPFTAVIYDVKGGTWAYTNPEPLTYVRAPITIDYVDGEWAYLSDGPEAGTEVVTLGAAELYGAETGVGK